MGYAVVDRVLAAFVLVCRTAVPAAAECSGGTGSSSASTARFRRGPAARHRPAPISMLLGRVGPRDGSLPPQLNRIELAFGARGGLDTPDCRSARAPTRNATQGQALARCGGALVGTAGSRPKSRSIPDGRSSPTPRPRLQRSLAGGGPRSGSTPTRPRRRSPSSSPSTCAPPRRGLSGS